MRFDRGEWVVKTSPNSHTHTHTHTHYQQQQQYVAVESWHTRTRTRALLPHRGVDWHCTLNIYNKRSLTQRWRIPIEMALLALNTPTHTRTHTHTHAPHASSPPPCTHCIQIIYTHTHPAN